MGMDVFGKEPQDKTGEYFRNNVWWWRPLWHYCELVAPDVIPADNLGGTNDGWGLDAEGSVALADLLQKQIDAGGCAEHAAERDKQLKALPDEPCRICEGTGQRAEAPEAGPGDQPCNGCKGTGKTRPWDCAYPFDVDNVEGFVKFLRTCGGFEIC